MPKAQTRASNKYNAKAYDRIALQVRKGQKEQIANYAASKGLSLNGYINKLIADDMGEDLTVPKQGET
ncbi:MAG: antitoxin [Oscillospiraceae bacterium]|nr:antitoxin [Oscillospiraceae bacterium]